MVTAITDETCKCISRALRELNRRQQQINKYRELLVDATHDAIQLEDLIAKHKGPWERLELDAEPSYGGTQFRIWAWRIKDLRGITPLLKDLIGMGYHPVKTGDDELSGTRTYDYGKVRVVAVLAEGEGVTCRKVQVGTKEVPVYKIECDEA